MSTIPGLIQPTIASYPAGANSPATAAKMINDANNQKLQNINQMAAGGSTQVAVPVIKPIYNQQNGQGSDPISQQAQSQTLSMQSVANSVYDDQASKMGGKRRKKYSKKRKSTKKNKTRKNKRKTRHRRR